jgi:hypothetical protein
MGQINSAEERKLISGFESVKRMLLQEEFSDRWDKPLAYWALPNDRRLPLAFLDRSLGELLQTPFHVLSATRGVGHKKVGTLVKLLNRATSKSPPAVPFGIKELADNPTLGAQPTSGPTAAASSATFDEHFDPALVSEALWELWCETVKRFHLDHEPIGRVATSLVPLPTVIWQTPLGEYSARRLSEIRQLRTHGEKRVRVVLEVFYTVHQMLSSVKFEGGHLALRLVPRFVPATEDFIANVVRTGRIVDGQELTTNLVTPILEQIRVDAGETLYELCSERLGAHGIKRSVRDQAMALGLTRARVYQMLEDCGRIMEVRWPEGRRWLLELAPKVAPSAKKSFQTLFGLLYPSHERDEAVQPEIDGGDGIDNDAEMRRDGSADANRGQSNPVLTTAGWQHASATTHS